MVLLVSKDLADQDLSVALFSRLGIASSLEAAEGHRDAIARFGRFPYRNDALGRTSTPDEKKFLKDPPPWGKTKAEIEAMQRQKDETNCAKTIQNDPKTIQNDLEIARKRSENCTDRKSVV